MKLDNLSYLGLTDGEIKVYEMLVEKGPQDAASIIKLTGLKKGDCYNKVYDLVQKGLVEEFEQAKKKHFRLVDPRKLEELAGSQYQTAIQARREIDSALPQILSGYTLSHHRPSILLFEGEEAMRRTLEDSLTAKTVIFQYVDAEAAEKYYQSVNRAYVAKREKLKKVKHIMAVDTPFHRQYFGKLSSEITEVKLISRPMSNWKTSMQIYDNKVSYLTLTPEAVIGILIEDPLVSQMQRDLFEYAWSTAKEIPNG